MKEKHGFLRSTIRGLLPGLILSFGAGCASISDNDPTVDVTPKETFSDLYDGKSTATFATEFTPSSPEEARQLGSLALEQGDLDKALYHFIQALNMDEQDVESLINIAAIHGYRDNLDLAGLAYQRALVINREDTRALTGVGIVLMEKRNLETARKVLTRSLELKPEQWQAHNAMGIIEDLEEEHQAAIVHFLAALEINPESPMLMNNLGYSYYLADEWDSARTMYRKAVAANPDYQRGWQNLGLLYLREGSYRSALDAFSHTMDAPQAYNDLGYLAMLDGNYVLSERLLEQAIDKSPSYYRTANENMDRVKELMRVARSNSQL